MKILEDIINRLDCYDPQKDYFHYTTDEREHIVSVLWDEVYGEDYRRSLRGKSITNPLQVQLDILLYLMSILSKFEREDEFELCDVVQRLINITEHKIDKIEEDYANSKKKTD